MTDQYTLDILWVEQFIEDYSMKDTISGLIVTVVLLVCLFAITAVAVTVTGSVWGLLPLLILPFISVRVGDDTDDEEDIESK